MKAAVDLYFPEWMRRIKFEKLKWNKEGLIWNVSELNWMKRDWFTCTFSGGSDNSIEEIIWHVN